MTSSLPVLITIAVVSFACSSIVGVLADGRANAAPHIFEEPLEAETAYKVGEEIKLVCVADSESKPSYEWRKDGQLLDMSAGHIVMLPGVGTISIMKPTPEDDGVYQCFAKNKHGTAVSIKTALRAAVLQPFRTSTSATVHNPKVGDPLTLRCNPPLGYPKGSVYWGISKPGSTKLGGIENDARVVLDYDGHLRFTNVLMGDESKSDTRYSCAVYNGFLRASVQGDDQAVQPVALTGSAELGRDLDPAHTLGWFPMKQLFETKVYAGCPGGKGAQTTRSRIALTAAASGHLRITNVAQVDSLEPNAIYVCVANNPVLRSFVQGDDQKVIPIDVSGEPTRTTPAVMWTSPRRDVALRGRSKKLKCIFSGYPTPRVTWTRTDNKNDRFRETRDGHGTEIEIASVDYEDAARYRCTASNGHGTPQSVELTLEVQSMPYWRQGKKPADKQVDEDDGVEFECQADGNPRPDITWSVNGIPIENLSPDSRRTLDGTTLRYSTVTRADNAVFQCMANNTHGHIIANAALTVIAAAPTFTTTPADQKVVRGQTVTFNCRVQGAPKPQLTWRKDTSSTTLSGGRFTVQPSGDLQITDTGDRFWCANDSGFWTQVSPSIENKLGSDEASAKLVVREPTRITEPPQSQSVNVDDTVTLECAAVTDPNENLTVQWLRNNETIDFRRQRHLSYDPRTHRLTIQQAAIRDTASYSCRAVNGLDSVESPEAVITVRGRPEPPRDVSVSCTTTHATVTWYPGADNNDPITEFVVQYRETSPSTSAASSNEVEFKTGPTLSGSGKTTSSNQLMTATVVVRPWRSYEFRVVAKNGLGESDPSSTAGSKSRCVTPQSAPKVNPRGVCTLLRATGQLAIVWEPVAETDYSGEGFYYVVKYRLMGTSGDPRTTAVEDPTRSEIVIHNLQTFSEYEISVQSANSVGLSTSHLDEIIGYSGEGKPLDVPTNLQLLQDTLNSTHAMFSWLSVDQSAERVRGFFRGYRIVLWKVDDPNARRHEDIILQPVPLTCRPADSEFVPPTPSRRRRREAAQHIVSGLTGKLWPYSRIRAAVAVLNAANVGSESDPIEFSTPEGVAGPVNTASVVERGSNHLVVEWTPPTEPNGVIKAYYVTCIVAPPNVGSPKTFVVDPTTLTRTIVELESSTVYRIEVAAETNAGGRGPAAVVNGETRPADHPDKPIIGAISNGYDSAVVTFRPTMTSSDKSNPGTSFYVEYVDKDNSSQSPWPRTETVPGRGLESINVTGLQPGREYTFRVVAINGIHDHIRETRSDPKSVQIGPDYDDLITFPTPATDNPGIPPVVESQRDMARASSEWYIILIVIIAILLVILMIVCIVRRTRGEMYPVWEKEKLRGRDPLAPEDAPFGEYVAGCRPDLERSQGSLNSDEKPLDSETDSLGEYEDPEASKFNEDGSFIGLYSGQRSRPGHPPQQTTSPYATNTFV